MTSHVQLVCNERPGSSYYSCRTMQLVIIVLVFLTVLTDASININTLPPDFRRLEFSEVLSPRSTINPAWAGDHSAALDGEQNKVFVSWSLIGDHVEFQVYNIMYGPTIML